MVTLPRLPDRGLTTVIPAADGFPLGATVFEPRRPRATVVIHGATAVPHGYYEAFAGHLAGRARVRVVAYDYRGVGASRPGGALAGFAATMTDWARLDARAVHAWARDLGDPIVLVGHSFGGQLLGLVDELREARGALLVASQLGWYRDWPLAAQPRLALLFRVATPLLTGAFGYLPGRAGLGVDLPAGVAREWARWCTSPGYLVDHDPEAAARFARWDRPTLLLGFTDDDFAPPRTVAALRRRLRGAPLEHRTWRPGDRGLDAVGHFGFFRPRAAALWPDAVGFVGAVLAGVDPRRDVLRAADLEADLRFGRD
jgi:predicted alpha/beta hydrolase